jgi:hypothetical protein
MEPEGSLPHSQVPATCPYPESTCKECEFIIYVENFLHVRPPFVTIFREVLNERYVTKKSQLLYTHTI